MRYHSITVNNDELKSLNKLYEKHIVEVNDENVYFAAVHNNVRIHAYNDGTLILSGRNMNDEYLTLKKFLKRKNFQAIGSAETGLHDVFGPLVFCSVYISLDDIEFLKQFDIDEKESFSDREVISIAPKIFKKLIHTLLIISPKKYNELISQDITINQLKARLHNQTILRTNAKIDFRVPVVLDQFVTQTVYYSSLREEIEVLRNVMFYQENDDKHIALKVAYIIARYAYLVKLSQYNKKLDTILRKGKGENVQVMFKEILEKFGEKTLGEVAKFNIIND